MGLKVVVIRYLVNTTLPKLKLKLFKVVDVFCALVMFSHNVVWFEWQYREDGYLVLEGVFSPEECEALRKRMSEIVEQMDVPVHCRIQFSTDHDEQLKSQVMLL